MFRAGVRRRWRAWVALALLIGLFAAVVVALAAGARAHPDVPLLLTAALVAGALVLAVVVAALPGEAAARANPSIALRSE